MINAISKKSTPQVVNFYFNFLMELKLKLEWLEGVSKNLRAGQASQIFLKLPQAIPTSIPIPFRNSKLPRKLVQKLALKSPQQIVKIFEIFEIEIARHDYPCRQA